MVSLIWGNFSFVLNALLLILRLPKPNDDQRSHKMKKKRAKRADDHKYPLKSLQNSSLHLVSKGQKLTKSGSKITKTIFA